MHEHFRTTMDQTDIMQHFWNFTIKHYQIEDVRRIVLHFQDTYGADVNLLFLALWRARVDLPSMTKAQVSRIASQVEEWRTKAIEPLREIRTGLRDEIDHVPDPERTNLRAQVLKLEIESERIEQLIIESSIGSLNDESDAGEIDCDTAACNLAVVLSTTSKITEFVDQPSICHLLTQFCPGTSQSAIRESVSRRFPEGSGARRPSV